MLSGEKNTISENQFQFCELLYYVEDMMQTRQLEIRQKPTTAVPGDKPDYKWLSSLREEPPKLSNEQLVKIRQLATKMTAEECSSVICRADDILNTTGKSLTVEDIPKLIEELLDRKQVCSLLAGAVEQKKGTILRSTSTNDAIISERQPRHSVSFDPEPSYMIFSVM